MAHLTERAVTNPAHHPLTVTATLAAGLAHTTSWGIALDGLLAAALFNTTNNTTNNTTHVQDADPVHALDEPDPPDLPLPLARCVLAGENLWHWAATCSYPTLPDGTRAPALPEVRYWTARTDHRHLEQTAGVLPAAISDRQGRYRARRTPLLVTTCTQVSWSAIGDPDAIATLLTPIRAIGKKRSHGEGHVLAWDIRPAGTLDPFTAGHLHPDGTLGRPTPPACLTSNPATATAGAVMFDGPGTAGLRPPYMHLSRHRQLLLPPQPTDTEVTAPTSPPGPAHPR